MSLVSLLATLSVLLKMAFNWQGCELRYAYYYHTVGAAMSALHNDIVLCYEVQKTLNGVS